MAQEGGEVSVIQDQLWTEPVQKLRWSIVWVGVTNYTGECEHCRVIVRGGEERCKVVPVGGGRGTDAWGHGKGKFVHLECGIRMVKDSWSD